MTPEPSKIVLEAAGIAKSFPGVRALEDVSLRIREGRLLAILGENGAGKSTLINILAGVFPPDAGSILVDGNRVEFPHPGAALAAGIGVVFQELNLVPHLSVAENILLGREPRDRIGLIDYRRLNAAAAAVLKRVGLPVDAAMPLENLRVGQQQLVEIARALSRDARVVILDEPTSSLSAHESAALFGAIAELKARGVAFVYITHRLEELAHICDDVVILRDGRVVHHSLFGQLNREQAVRLMAGKVQTEFGRPPGSPLGPELIRADALTLRGNGAGRPWLVDRVSFSVRAGEVLGLFGLVGAGRTELLEVLFGLHPGRAAGRIFVAGQPIAIASPAEAIAAGIGLAPEDRKRDGLVLSMSVAANASLASLRRTLRFGLVDRNREAAQVRPYLDRFRVKIVSLAQPVAHLSGGNQQKVILAKWLATSPRILLLDEPTRGIDVNAKREIHAFIGELARQGLSLIVVSSDLEEVLTLSDRVLVMCDGRKAAEFTRADARAENVLAAALPERTAA